MADDLAIKQRLVSELDKLPKTVFDASNFKYADFSSHYPQLASRINKYNVTIFSLDNLSQIPPTLAVELKASIERVNAVSLRDKDIPEVNQVLIVHGEFPGNASMNLYRSPDMRLMSTMAIGSDWLKSRDMSDIRAVLDHEHGHFIDANSVNGNAVSDSYFTADSVEKKAGELKADRYADAIAMLNERLKNIETESGKSEYGSLNNTHPTTYQLASALLAELYGNNIFGMSGVVSGVNGRFIPRKLSPDVPNSLPVTEDNKTVSNWYTLERAIAKQVKADMTLLTSYVNSDGLSKDERLDFMQYVADSVKKFKAKADHQPTISIQQNELVPSSSSIKIAATEQVLNIVAEKLKQKGMHEGEAEYQSKLAYALQQIEIDSKRGVFSTQQIAQVSDANNLEV